MKTKLLLCAWLIFMGLALPYISAIVCDDITEKVSIPCEIITPTINCSTNANISNSYNSSINQSVLMFLIDPLCTSDCSYNFSFNYSEIGSYQVDLCENSFAVINVVEKRASTTSVTNWVSRGTDTIIKTKPLSVEDIERLTKNIIFLIRDLSVKYYWLIVPGAFIILGIFKRKKIKSVFVKEKK
jgi:hypothetical protein